MFHKSINIKIFRDLYIYLDILLVFFFFFNYFCFNNFYSHVNISIMSNSFKENLIPLNKNIFFNLKIIEVFCFNLYI